MAQIVTTSYFINDLHIPNSQVEDSIGLSTPNSVDELQDCCNVIEKELLLNAFGLTIYNQLQTALADLDTADIKWKYLVNGREYDNKKWEGLKNPKSLIAYAVFFNYLNSNSDYYTTFGTVKANAANSTNVTPFYKLVSAWNKFLKKYQAGYCEFPERYYGIGWEFTDWRGNGNDVEVSLYEYMVDHADDFGWSPDKFKFYESLNTFGI